MSGDAWNPKGKSWSFQAVKFVVMTRELKSDREVGRDGLSASSA